MRGVGRDPGRGGGIERSRRHDDRRDAGQPAGLEHGGHSTGWNGHVRLGSVVAASGRGSAIDDRPTTTAKAQYLHDADTSLSSVNEAGYSTIQVSGSRPSRTRRISW